MFKQKITVIKGVGKTLEKYFARIDMYYVDNFKEKSVESIFTLLAAANLLKNHKTSKNYLYLIRMIIYVANGGDDEIKIRWNYWKGWLKRPVFRPKVFYVVEFAYALVACQLKPSLPTHRLLNRDNWVKIVRGIFR